MTTAQLKIGDIITFTNKVGYDVKIIVSRVEEKSWYTEKGFRNSYGTLKSYSTQKNFKILSA